MAKRTKRRAENDAGTARWNERIGPFCEFASGNRGFITAVAEEINKTPLMAVRPQQVREWLVKNTGDRVEPRAGMAELLVEACEVVQRKTSQRKA